MGIQIEDGTGTGQTAGISTTGNRLNVSSRSDERIYYISRDNGDSYTATSVDTAAAGEYNFYFKNTSTSKKFYITGFNLGSAELAIFKIATVTGTAAGSSIVPVNLNRTSGNVADAECFGNAAVTGLTEETLLEVVSVPADNSKEVTLHDSLVLGQGDAVAIEYDTGAGATMHVTMIGFFDAE
jgi:hypothetical protein